MSISVLMGYLKPREKRHTWGHTAKLGLESTLLFPPFLSGSSRVRGRS